MATGDLFRQDVEKYYKELGWATPTLSNKLSLWLGNHGFHCVASYRFGNFARAFFARHRILGFLPVLLHRVLSYFVGMVYHVNITCAKIDAGLFIGHVGTIYIGPTEIGKNLSITHNVTIGKGHSTGKAGVPKKLGDNVWIGTGATIYGDIIIGNDVTIASGSVVSQSIPDGCLVAGNPGRILLRNYDNRKLFAEGVSIAPGDLADI